MKEASIPRQSTQLTVQSDNLQMLQTLLKMREINPTYKVSRDAKGMLDFLPILSVGYTEDDKRKAFSAILNLSDADGDMLIDQDEFA